MNRRLDIRKNAPTTGCHVPQGGQAPAFPKGWPHLFSAVNTLILLAFLPGDVATAQNDA
jgi:hypothetical protein